MNIFLVEDNLTIIKGLKYSFKQNGKTLEYRTTIKEAAEYIKSNDNIDLIILDVTLPDGNGFDLYKELIRNMNIPTIFLTAKDDEDDIVIGLNLGADDYITKPFSTKELIARINRILKRHQKQTIVNIGDISYDLDKMVLYKKDNIIELTSLELKLLNLLFTNLNKVVSRTTMLEKIWEWTGNDVDNHTITVYLKRIREKIKSDIIVTVKGIGYRIDSDEK